MATLGGIPMLPVVWATQWVTPPAWDHVAVSIATAVVAAVGGWIAMGWAIRRG